MAVQVNASDLHKSTTNLIIKFVFRQRFVSNLGEHWVCKFALGYLCN